LFRAVLRPAEEQRVSAAAVQAMSTLPDFFGRSRLDFAAVRHVVQKSASRRASLGLRARARSWPPRDDAGGRARPWRERVEMVDLESARDLPSLGGGHGSAAGARECTEILARARTGGARQPVAFLEACARACCHG
jgi:hypothetical protein